VAGSAGATPPPGEGPQAGTVVPFPCTGITGCRL